MLETTLTDQPTADQRRRATAAIKRHAHGADDETELLAMLGLDHEPTAPTAPHRPHAALSAAELFELFAPLVAERAEALTH